MPTSLLPRLTRLHNHRIHIPLFSIFYSTTYTLLLTITLLLLAITPADQIYQIIAAKRLGNIFVVGCVYFATAVIASFIYASRLYTNRASLAGIPRSYVAVGRGEVDGGVRKVVERGWMRSALVAAEGMPRVLGEGPGSDASGDGNGNDTEKPEHLKPNKNHFKINTRKKKQSSNQTSGTSTPLLPYSIPLRTANPPWGHPRHAGWSSPSPSSATLPPNLPFDPVIAELPNLLEAKAVALAPLDPAFDFLASQDRGQNRSVVSGTSAGNEEGMELDRPPDPAAVAFLQRPLGAGLREYVKHLASAGLFTTVSENELEGFVTEYERARFGDVPFSEREFDGLMARFGRVLEGLGKGVDLETLRVLWEERGVVRKGEGLPQTPTGSVRRMRLGARMGTVQEEEGRRVSIAESVATSSSSSSVVRHSVPRRNGRMVEPG